jgi:DNA-binding transcriptional regulator GbsR (MarR family)
MSKNIKQEVENLGVVFEKFGRSPMVSRVFAFLLLSEPPHQSFEQIVEFLDASKSSISNTLHFLQAEGTVSYITFSGERKRYFKIDTKVWMNNLIGSANNLSAFNILLENVLSLRSESKHQDFNDEIQKLLDFQTFLSEKIEIAVREWRSK